MNEVNEVYLSGVISKIYPLMVTPSEVKVSRFVLEHSSQQIEGGVNRLVNCRIFCVYLGEVIVEEQLNSYVKVKGFLSVNMQKKVVLHVTEIKILD
jgi:primosomal replication protein N